MLHEVDAERTEFFTREEPPINRMIWKVDNRYVTRAGTLTLAGRITQSWWLVVATAKMLRKFWRREHEG